MKVYNIALIGFGGVNRALAELVATKNQYWEQDFGFRLNIVAVSDINLGSVISPNGLDAKMLVGSSFPKGGFGKLSGGIAEVDNNAVINNAPADIVVEATFTNPCDGEPAISHCRLALSTGKHVVTTNKGPVAIAGAELKSLARSNGVRFEFEGSVMSGTPVIRMAKQNLAGAELTGFEGILNGTSNFVLGRMEAGHDLSASVAEAQRLGYAEANPIADIEGFDVRLKVVILANELLGAHLKPDDVHCAGISGISLADIEAAKRANTRWKLVGSAARDKQGSVVGKVAPVQLGSDHPLCAMNGVTNAISLNTRLLGPVTMSGPGAGRVETAYALLSDILAIHGLSEAALKKEAA